MATLLASRADSLRLLQTLKQARKGDFKARARIVRTGVDGEIVEVVNDLLEMNERFADEIERISELVGKQGKVGKRASMGPAVGRWARSIDAINGLIEDLVQPSAEAARVIGAVARGDLSQQMPLEIDGRRLRGAFRDMADSVNTMVTQLGSFASEVTRVAREVGTEGKLGGQAVVRGMGGIWEDLTKNVNKMASNLTSQVRNIAAVTTAVANGDLSQKITVEVSGELLQLKETMNKMVDQLRSFSSEVTRVAREVGTEGKLGAQAEVKDVAGVWKDLTNNVNFMAANLTSQVRNIAEVTKAVAQGDLSKKITVDVRGEILELKNTINIMVDQLNSFAGEVTRVAREVGTEGKLGGQAQVKGVAGVWKDLTSNVNSMASNLTSQVRNIADVTTAVANGDLSRKITVPVRGEILQLKNTINTMVDQLNSFASEVTRVAREVGVEGKLGGQAEVKGVAGVWKDLTNNVNFMASNLTGQVRNINEVTRAIAKGDLSKKITVEVKGEILQLKNTINTMVDQLNSFASEVTRVAREVGTEGKLGGQARVRGVAGVWKDLTNNVNFMARNLTNQVRNIAEVNRAIAKGDLSKKITIKARGEILQLKVTINKTVDLLNRFSGEVTRVAREVGTEGKLGGQAKVRGVAGVWKDLTNNVNFMASNLTGQVRNIAEVTTAVAQGDLSKKITVEVSGEILALKDTINTMVDQLRSFASEVTRVAREVGFEGKLGGQAEVKGVAGVWKDLTNNVNFMAGNLTSQVRNISEVTRAIAKGDLSKKITVEVKGEILLLKNTINAMVDRLNSFASEVTRVAREVGTEGKLGGQAKVKDVAGVWKDLTNNVNFMARNLTNQVRNIAEVNRAIAKGDLSKKITIKARGEVLQLKVTINNTVDLLNRFAGEVTRVAREVGTEGKLGGQAKVRGVAGVWKGLTDNVNFMASNLTGQVRNIAEVTTAVAQGDLSKKITVEVSGEILQLKDTINTMVDQLRSFASEVTRVAREVGFEGKLGGQAEVKGVAGVWKDLTNNVNFMAGNLTSQVRNIADVTTAVANGDLSRKITVDVRGEILGLKDTINTMVDQLNSFAGEVTRVAREVGTEGKLGGQAKVKGVAGVWKDLTENVNSMASNLTGQVRNIVEVTTAVAQGDLSKKITVDVKGEILELKNTINTMVDQLNSFASEVTRVAREVGTEGKLGGQAEVRGVAGVWKGLTDNVNFMASNLTGQVRNIAEVTTAVAQGDLSKKITVEVQGEILALKDTINTMVDQLRSFASEVTRVAREVGFEGKLGGQADVRGVAGVWKDLTNSVNFMAGNLTDQVRNIAEVTTAVAQGDLSRKITVDVRGEILQLKDTVNTMVDQLRSFAAEVTRVAREVGVEGKLGGQARVKGVAGVWKDLTDNVNSMASNLTGQVRNIAEVTTAVARGNLSKKITVDVRGEILELKNTINTMVDQLNSFASEVTRVAREVGSEGKLGGQAQVKGVAGVWKDLTNNVNSMASNLTSQVRNIAEVTTAVANGDLSRKITVKVRGEILQLKKTINTMVDQLNDFASEVTRVAREVGTDGKLGGQAKVEGVAGVWKDLTENVNSMAFNLTNQVRGIAKVVTAVANGNLKLKLPLQARGEIAALADTINDMIDTLATFADQVTTVAREVGVEGQLGGQARVPGAMGTWRDLTDNVNQLAANLTNQVRAIADVSTAVTKGDLSQSITVEAHGEVAALKNNINQMIRNLAATTRTNAEQDWLKSNLARLARLLQGQRDLETAAKLTLSELAPLVNAQLGAFYAQVEGEPKLRRVATYGRPDEELPEFIEFGQGMVGQAAIEQKRFVIEDATLLPPLGVVIKAQASNMVIFPIPFEGQVKGVIELASVAKFSEIQLSFIDLFSESIGIVMNTITSTMRTEGLLSQSLSMSKELQHRQEQLQKTNAELEERSRLLSEQKKEVEAKNREIEVARSAIEEKAEQLALTSKYKSQFLANMSHELRTPLNSLLVLARTLAENPDKNLSRKQVEFSQTIYASGKELLLLINDILDLSKIESGTISLEVAFVSFKEMQDYVDRNFRPIADEKRLELAVESAPDLPSGIYTDAHRLKQVLRNLLSNALKFTQAGRVTLRIHQARSGWSAENPTLSRARGVIALSVSDTGIGIPPDKQKIIFEAFQQVDMTTSRKYGGTGLGLSISRKLAELLGGEIRVESVPKRGSTFTLYLPMSVGAPTPHMKEGGVPAAGAAGAKDFAVAAGAEIFRDDRHALKPGDRVGVAIVAGERDARTAVEALRDAGLKAYVTTRGETGISAAKKHGAQVVLLDPRLTDAEGWVVLDRLKHDASTRHIPVCVVVEGEPEADRALRLGAFGVLARPFKKAAAKSMAAAAARFAARKERRVLLVEPDERAGRELAELLEAGGVRASTAKDAAAALEALARRPFDCMVVGSHLPDMEPVDLAARAHGMAKLRDLPVIVRSPQPGAPRKSPDARTVVVPEAKEQLVERLALTLHQREDAMPEEERRLVKLAHGKEPALAGRRILIVDDDARNIFALSSVLERHDVVVAHAENGREALASLQTGGAAFDAVLMDVMMPDMDGYAAMRAIRALPQFNDLPIVAITAKAMPGDREKCLEAGASDYLPKPVDVDLLLSVLRVWLAR